MGETRISWTDYSFNPWIGCTKVSEGCKFCYAEAFVGRRLAVRMVKADGVVVEKFWGDKAPRRFRPEAAWKDPLKWNRQAARHGALKCRQDLAITGRFTLRPVLDAWRDGVILCRRCWP